MRPPRSALMARASSRHPVHDRACLECRYWGRHRDIERAQEGSGLRRIQSRRQAGCTTSWDGTTGIWDVSTGAAITFMKGDRLHVIGHLQLRRRTDRTASARGSVWILDAASGREVATLEGHDGEVSTAAFSTDSKRVVTASHDKTARIWDVSSISRKATFWSWLARCCRITNYWIIWLAIFRWRSTSPSAGACAGARSGGDRRGAVSAGAATSGISDRARAHALRALFRNHAQPLVPRGDHRLGDPRACRNGLGARAAVQDLHPKSCASCSTRRTIHIWMGDYDVRR